MTQYQVVGACAHVRTMTPSGPMTRLLDKGALLPSGVPADRIRHLLSVGLIKAVGSAGPELPGAAVPGGVADERVPSAEGSVDPGSQGQSGSPDDDPERAAARAKLPADGALPHHAAGQPVWVEWHVAQGGNYDDLKNQDKATLVELAKSRQS